MKSIHGFTSIWTSDVCYADDFEPLGGFIDLINRKPDALLCFQITEIKEPALLCEGIGDAKTFMNVD
ncbi:hypothetical protein Bca4012_056284 [Brassica carinata]